MRAIFVLLCKDISLFRRDKPLVLITFIVPFLLIYLFGQIFGVNRKDPGPNGILLAVVNQSSDPAAATLVKALKDEKTFRVVTTTETDGNAQRPLTEDDLKPMLRAGRFRFAVVLPADMIDGKQIGLHIKIYSNPRNEIETQMVNGILQKTIFTNVPQLIGRSLQSRAKNYVGSERADKFNQRMADSIAETYGGDRAKILRDIESGDFIHQGSSASGGSESSGAATDFLAKLVRVDREQVGGENVKSPAATQVVGGWAMQFLLFAVAASATGLFHEKEQGLFQRILSAPVRRSDILWSRFIYGVCLGVVQLIVLFAAGSVLFGIDVQHHIGPLLLVCIFAAAACTSFGMLIAAVAGSPEAARGISTLLILLMSAIGGAWFPVSFMPETLQHLSKFTLVYWSMEGFSQVLWAQVSWVELLPTLGILAAMSAIVMGVAWWRFSKGRIFE